MPILPIRYFPDSILRRECQKVHRFDRALGKIVRDLRQTMHSQPHGIGIAAPQAGIGLQIALVDVSARVSGAQEWLLINPIIHQSWEEKISREGCMSLPDYTAYLKRFEHIHLAWQDLTGQPQEREFSGLEAVCIQHEVDHLQGKLFIDRVTSLKRDMIPRQPSKKPA